MKFIKRFERRYPHYGFGAVTCYIKDGCMKVVISRPGMELKETGLTADGIGVVLEKSKKQDKASNKIQIIRKIEFNDLPSELRCEGYRYFIPGKEVAENEFLFKFSAASIKNKKK